MTNLSPDSGDDITTSFAQVLQSCVFLLNLDQLLINITAAETPSRQRQLTLNHMMKNSGSLNSTLI